jgi:CubicO group peptidase (beta-lactamase class C family)
MYKLYIMLQRAPVITTKQVLNELQAQYLTLKTQDGVLVSPSSIITVGNLDSATTCKSGEVDGDRGFPTTGMWYDLASLTKTFTATLVLQTIDRDKLRLDTPLHTVHPAGEYNHKITIKHLLTHTSSLLMGDIYDKAKVYESENVKNWYRDVNNFKLPTGRPRLDIGEVMYSDSNYIILGQVLESIWGVGLDQMIEEMLVTVGIDDILFNPLKPRNHSVVALEDIVSSELDQFGKPITGIVHDEKCRWMGGVAGHAGLFATHNALKQYAKCWLTNAFGLSDILYTQAFGSELQKQEELSFGLVFRRGFHSQYPNMAGFTGPTIILDPQNELYYIHTPQIVFPQRAIGEERRTLNSKFNWNTFETLRAKLLDTETQGELTQS